MCTQRARRRLATLSLCALGACGGPAHGVESGAGTVSSDASATRVDGSRPDPGDAADATTDAAQGRADAEAPDARSSGGDAATRSDASDALDAARPDSDADANAADARVQRMCVYPFVPAYEVCLAAPAVAAGAQLATQDTANGARADCAVHASGPGGRNLYYRIKLPPGRATIVAAKPVDPAASVLLRILGDCHAERAERGGRGANGSRVAFCLPNTGATEREVILAVGHYSGESGDLTLSFDLTVEGAELGQTCGS